MISDDNDPDSVRFTSPPSVPEWIRAKAPWNENSKEVKDLLRGLTLNSVCLSAACPNRGECWETRHVTFMILGRRCTRGCMFCDVTKGVPEDVDIMEPDRLAKAVKALGIKYVVVTSVTRDDLADKGSGQFIKTAVEVKKTDPNTVIEILIPDMGGDEALLQKIALSKADVVAHNIEMPLSLYPSIRPGSSYETSLKVLRVLKNCSRGVPVKSSFMIGLGETRDDISRTIDDLKDAGVDMLYIGQYLRPSKKSVPVKKYYDPEEFDAFRSKAILSGIKVVRSGPMVRSSYKAYESYIEWKSGLSRSSDVASATPQ